MLTEMSSVEILVFLFRKPRKRENFCLSFLISRFLFFFLVVFEQVEKAVDLLSLFYE